MHGPPSSSLHRQPQSGSTQSGFSLVEITLAIGIIAFAFVALLGLLPAGMQTFRTAIDTGNEARIIQTFISKVLATEFDKVKTMDFVTTKEIYYFDEEGSVTDTSVNEITELKPQRLYGAKLFVEQARKVGATGTMLFSTNVVVVFANLASPAKTEFETIETLDKLREHLKEKDGKTNLRVRTVLVSKMDGQT